MTDVELLPLPDGYKYSPPLYDGQMFCAGQMRAYARANVAHAIAPMQAEIEALRAEVDRLRKDAERRYGVHDQACSATDIPICTCGLDAMLKAREASND